MDNIYSKRITTTYADVDFTKIVKPSSILNYFQCLAGEHVSLLGVGNEALEKLGIFWVLSKIYYVVHSPIPVNQDIIVTTWPLETGKIICDRDFAINDAITGKLLVSATSKWCVLDRKNHKPVPAKILKFELDSFKTERALDFKLAQIKTDENYSFFSDKNFTINYTDLDFNMHANNIRYADFVMRLFKANEIKNKTVREFQLNYQKECVEDEIINLNRYDNQIGNHIIIGKNGDEDAFSCKIKLI